MYEEFPYLRMLNVDISVLHFKPIDSSNVTPALWIELARLIRDSYASFDGFVVLHGTDTMAYSASALSFMIENLGKPGRLHGQSDSDRRAADRRAGEPDYRDRDRRGERGRARRRSGSLHLFSEQAVPCEPHDETQLPSCSMHSVRTTIRRWPTSG